MLIFSISVPIFPQCEYFEIVFSPFPDFQFYNPFIFCRVCKCQCCCIVPRSVCALLWEEQGLHPVHFLVGGRVEGGRGCEIRAEMRDKRKVGKVVAVRISVTRLEQRARKKQRSDGTSTSWSHQKQNNSAVAGPTSCSTVVRFPWQHSGPWQERVCSLCLVCYGRT